MLSRILLALVQSIFAATVTGCWLYIYVRQVGPSGPPVQMQAISVRIGTKVPAAILPSSACSRQPDLWRDANGSENTEDGDRGMSCLRALIPCDHPRTFFMSRFTATLRMTAASSESRFTAARQKTTTPRALIVSIERVSEAACLLCTRWRYPSRCA